MEFRLRKKRARDPRRLGRFCLLFFWLEACLSIESTNPETCSGLFVSGTLGRPKPELCAVPAWSQAGTLSERWTLRFEFAHDPL